MRAFLFLAVSPWVCQQSRPAGNHAQVTAKELSTISAYPHAHDLRLGLRLLVPTGGRPGELREARWDEFDRKAGLWVIPAERMKTRRPHTVPLSRQVLDAPEQLHRMTASIRCCSLAATTAPGRAATWPFGLWAMPASSGHSLPMENQQLSNLWPARQLVRPPYRANESVREPAQYAARTKACSYAPLPAPFSMPGKVAYRRSCEPTWT